MRNGRTGGGTRPPALVIAMAIAFVLLMASLLVGSLADPEFPPYPPTVPHPRPVGDSLIGPADYTIDASSAARWARFDFERNSVVEEGRWDISFRRTHVIAAPHVGILDLGPVPFDSVAELPEHGYVSGPAPADSSHPAVGKWYEYNYLTHLLRSKGHVYAIRTPNGFAKLLIMSYYCRSVGTGCVTFRYAYHGGGRRVLR
jgi:hypothetical protein